MVLYIGDVAFQFRRDGKTMDWKEVLPQPTMRVQMLQLGWNVGNDEDQERSRMQRPRKRSPTGGNCVEDKLYTSALTSFSFGLPRAPELPSQPGRDNLIVSCPDPDLSL